MGFSGVFRRFGIETYRIRFDSDTTIVEVYVSGEDNEEARARLLGEDPEWYVYTLQPNDGWARVDNHRNGATNEWKRGDAVPATDIVDCKSLRLDSFLREHRVRIGDLWIG